MHSAGLTAKKLTPSVWRNIEAQINGRRSEIYQFEPSYEVMRMPKAE
jgi:hypothetical protein